MKTTEFFAHRMAVAFPEVSGLQWFDDVSDAAWRLDTLFHFDPREAPRILCLRGYQFLDAEGFYLRQGPGRCKFEWGDFTIRKLAAYSNPEENFRNFLYLETTSPHLVNFFLVGQFSPYNLAGAPTADRTLKEAFDKLMTREITLEWVLETLLTLSEHPEERDDEEE